MLRTTYSYQREWEKSFLATHATHRRFAIYQCIDELLSDLLNNKLGSDFTPIFLPKGATLTSLEHVCYIMSGYFPNVENISSLAKLVQDQQGDIDVFFRYRAISLSKEGFIPKDKINSLLQYENIRFMDRLILDPLTNPEIINNYDLISLPYITHGMFEMDNLNLDILASFLKTTQKPVMIF